MDLINKKILQLKLNDNSTQLVTNRIKKSEVISRNENGINEVIVYWGLEEMTELNQLVTFNQNLPSPITRDYEWSGLYEPFDHQRVTSEFLSVNKRAFCFNEAGTGKTSSALWAADYLMNEDKVKRVLIICPLSIMYSAWQADIFNTCMHRTSQVCHGTAEKRRLIINSEYEFVIINYDGVAIVKEDIKNADFDLIIIDEANAYKSTTTSRWKTISKIVKPHTRIWMMTGTPASQSPEDAFGLARLVCPERVPKFKTAWRDRVMYQVSRFRWLPRPTSKDEVFKALTPAIRFAKDECLDLPEVMYQTRDIPLTAQASKYYKQLKNQALIETGGEQISAVNAAAGMNKLLQISGGAVYTDTKETITFDIKPRLNSLLETVEETSHKVLVFVPYRHTINIVSEFLSKNNITNELIHGDVSARERFNLINRFQTETEPKVLVIQPQSASHGVTLTAANVVVFWSPVMSVEVYLQCIARIDRVGQKSKMTVVHLQGSPVEKRMYAMLRGKVDQHTKLVDLYREELET
jgi:SNF2 family DNA or RNA helicase|tara:strand:+ start:2542 stop:4110 length:1569 start_codon:yes stop_codon:yes gene_type:complete